VGRKKAAPNPEADAAAYERRKGVERARQAAMSASGRDIGDLPAVVNPTRKDRGRRDFRYFCEAYFPHTFDLPWSADHEKVIARIEQSVLEGGLFALAMPRGSGKSTICECACVWAALYGHREFVCLIGAEEGLATKMLASIKTEVETNDLLADDFPEVCYPVARLEGIANRCAGQLHRGERTHITWKEKEVVLATVAGSPASGAIVRVAGITGQIRGMKFKRPDGRPVRPDLVVIDDPQTDESARSPAQCATREGILAGAILGLAGPGKKIAGIMPCTVICPGDMADRILDRKKYPVWRGERTKTVYAWPAREDLWARYGEIRAESYQNDGDGSEATEFYRGNKDAMDEGAVVAWPERFVPGDLSAIQSAYNWRLDNEAAFMAEGQNEPLPPRRDDLAGLTADQVAGKLNRLAEGVVPVDAVRVTAFIDVQQSALFWLACAWADDFTGYVVGYGTYPDQQRPYFTLRDARRTLADLHPGGLEAQVYAGLESLTSQLLGRAWRRDDGADLRVERCLIDANWGASTDVVYQFCRQSAFPGVVVPSHGKFVGASSVPMGDWAKKPGDRAGPGWRIPALASGRPVRHCTYDTNFWKSFVHARIAVPMGSRGCLSLFGDAPGRHRLLADHLAAEFRVRVEGRGRVVDEWKLRPERPDNHWLDCLAGCAVAASVQGCALPEMQPARQGGRRKTLGEAMAQRPGVRRL